MSETYEESFAGSYNSVEDLSKSVTRFRLPPYIPLSVPPSIQTDGLEAVPVMSCVVNKFELHLFFEC